MPAISSPATPWSAADADMKHVLDILAEFEGKPIEMCTPAEARQQPTPDRAVAKILRQQGRDPDDDQGVGTEDCRHSGAGRRHRRPHLSLAVAAGRRDSPAAALHSRRRLGDRRSRQLRRDAPGAGQEDRRDRRLDALPAGARAQIPRRARRHLRRLAVDDRPCRGARRRSRPRRRSSAKSVGGNMAINVAAAGPRRGLARCPSIRC